MMAISFVHLASISESMAPIVVEGSLLVCFILGFFVLRLDVLARSSSSARNMRQKKIVEAQDSVEFCDAEQVWKAIHEDDGTSNTLRRTVVEAWRSTKACTPTSPQMLRPVVQALIDVDPEEAVQEIVEHMTAHASTLGNARTATTVLDVVARAGRISIMERLWAEFLKVMLIQPTSQMYEMRLGGHAAVGDQQMVDNVLQEMPQRRLKLTARGFSLTIKGFLKNCMVDAVLRQILEMQKQGFQVPPFAVSQFFRIACEASRAAEIFEGIKDVVPMPPEAVSCLLEDCAKRGDFEFARQVEQMSREKHVPLICAAYDALLKLHTINGDIHAIELFQEMQDSGARIGEGLCVSLLARCAESQFLRFADEIVRFTRARGSMSIAVYSALMKVYAYCGLYDKACNLYDQIREDGLEPDATMYGCLMKFSVECGRTAMSRELSELAPSLDIQNYMSLIRAAGRDGDVDKAFEVLKRLRDSGVALDVAAYNCVLDVCVSVGSMERAQALLHDMKEAGLVDVISYNTLMKGRCSCGDLKGAHALLLEMTQSGLQPNDVSYNSMLNAAVTFGNGNFQTAWETIELMEANGVRADHYTISIIMKALKKIKNTNDMARAFALLDRSGVEICSDEVLLNTVLETCTRNREYWRLETILTDYRQSSLRPSAHTYGSLIKACSTLRRLQECWEFWHEMAEHRAMEPNYIVLGCMLDALVVNNHLEDAVVLFNRWKERVPANTVMYSIIIKGFAASHQGARAMDAWREMRAQGIKLNTVVYNAVVDAQARIGNMAAVSELIEAMEPDGCAPDSITYSIIVKGYCVSGDLDRAFEIFCSMQNNNMAHDSIIYNTILDGCTRHGRWELADQVLAGMKNNQITPSHYTLGIVVKMWGRRKQLDKAFKALETMPRRFRFAPNSQVHTCLMCACLNNDAIDRAFEVFENLKSSGQGVDSKAYAALIQGCVRCGQLLRAVDLVLEAHKVPSTSDHMQENTRINKAPGTLKESVDRLLRALTQHGLMEQHGVPMLKKLHEARVPWALRLLRSDLSN